MPTYQYTGDLPTVFISITDANGHTWTPHKGDTIVLPYAVHHPHLTMTLAAEAPEVEAQDEPTPNEVVEETVNEPAAPETNESPVTADETEESQ